MEWLSRADQESLQLFQKFKRTVPQGIIPNGPTVQGVYVMTADGDFLSGYFAWSFKDRAKATIERGLNEFQKLARARGWKPQDVPTDKLDHSLGEPIRNGALKLRVAVRDLPRGRNENPGESVFQKCAHNISWTDFTAAEALQLVTERRSKQRLPNLFIERFSKSLKDCVRGQCGDWKKEEIKRSELFTELASCEGTISTMRITGMAEFSGSGRSLTCQIHGIVSYDSRTREFTKFDLVASGQRTGRDGANDRQQDMGPAPIGIAYALYEAD